jgi:hypothetical protein
MRWTTQRANAKFRKIFAVRIPLPRACANGARNDRTTCAWLLSAANSRNSDYTSRLVRADARSPTPGGGKGSSLSTVTVGGATIK